MCPGEPRQAVTRSMHFSLAAPCRPARSAARFGSLDGATVVSVTSASSAISLRRGLVFCVSAPLYLSLPLSSLSPRSSHTNAHRSIKHQIVWGTFLVVIALGSALTCRDRREKSTASSPRTAVYPPHKIHVDHLHPRRGRLGSGSFRPTACAPGLHTKQAAPSSSRCPTQRRTSLVGTGGAVPEVWSRRWSWGWSCGWSWGCPPHVFCMEHTHTRASAVIFGFLFFFFSL